MNKLLLIVLLLIIGCKNNNLKTPENFELYYTNSPTDMLRGSSKFIKITLTHNSCNYKKGEIYSFISKKDGEIKKKKTTQIQKEFACSKLTPIFKIIEEMNFFNFKNVYNNQVMDGDVEKLKISLDKKSKEVLVFNQANNDFEKIVKMIKELKVE